MPAKKGGENKMQPTVQQLMNGELDGSLEGFVFDPAVCRRAFDHYDKDKSGFLDTKEMMKLAEELVAEIINKTDMDNNKEVTYDEILPWFKSMNEKFWKITHPKSDAERARDAEAASAEKEKRERAAPPPADIPPPPADTASVTSVAGAGTGTSAGTGTGSSPNKYGLGSVKMHSLEAAGETSNSGVV